MSLKRCLNRRKLMNTNDLNMPSPVVSVCIITYNHGKFIRKCIEGVLMQETDFAFEIIIGDDCSTDNTAAVIREMQALHPHIIKPIFHSSNVGGVNNAYKYCYPKLTGKYVAICEGDDFWTDKQKLQKQVDFMERHPSVSLCFHRVNTVDENGDETARQDELPMVRTYNENEIFHLSIPTLSILFRKCFDIIPEELFRVKSCDTFLCGMLATYGKGADLGFVGASYRVHRGGIYSSRHFIDQVRQGIETRKIMKKSPVFQPQFRKVIGGEIRRRKLLYLKHFTKKLELLNTIKIILT